MFDDDDDDDALPFAGNHIKLATYKRAWTRVAVSTLKGRRLQLGRL